MSPAAVGARAPSRHVPAEACHLQIAGLVPLSSVDWPGHLAAAVFCQGCPWDCSYCHNPDLIPTRTPGSRSWSEVMEFLGRRRGLLDGVLFSGGEATRQAALGTAMAQVRDLGFPIGLHTAGPYPRRLAAVLPLVDWVGLDIKALPADYEQVVRRPNAGHLAWESLATVISSGTDHEVRITISPGSPAATHAVEVARRVLEAGARSFALQVVRTMGARDEFVAAHARVDQAAWREQVAHLDEQIRALHPPHYELRGA